MKSAALLILAIATADALAVEGLAKQAKFFQDLYGNPGGPTVITKGEMNVGETRPKAVLKGVYYFGGTDGKRTPLSSAYQKKLCTKGFSAAYSVYSKVSGKASCDGNVMEYRHIGQASGGPDGSAKVKELMREIFDVIKSDGARGPIYLHCYYGVHASNTISQMVLKQFCGIDDATAFRNWDKVNYMNSLKPPGPANEKAKIKAYQVDPRLTLTAEERAIVCY